MQQIEYALRSAQIQRTTTTRGTNSTYTHSSLLPLDVNTSPYEKRRGRDRVVEHSHHEYWFAFLHPVIVLTLPDRIARYVCTNNRAPNGNKSRSRRWKRERGERREGEEGLLLEENQSSLRNRLSSEGDREYNKQEFKRAEEKAIASKSQQVLQLPSLHRFTISKIYARRGTVLPRKQRERTPLEFIRAYDRWTPTWHGKHEIFLASAFYHSRNSRGLFILPSAEERLKNCHVRLYAPFSFISSFHGNTSRFDFHWIVCERAFGKKRHVPSSFSRLF